MTTRPGSICFMREHTPIMQYCIVCRQSVGGTYRLDDNDVGAQTAEQVRQRTDTLERLAGVSKHMTPTVR